MRCTHVHVYSEPYDPHAEVEPLSEEEEARIDELLAEVATYYSCLRSNAERTRDDWQENLVMLLSGEGQVFEMILKTIAKIDAIDQSLFWPGAKKRSRRSLEVEEG